MTDDSPPGRTARLSPWIVWATLVPGLWMAHGKATRHPSARAVAATYRETSRGPERSERVAFRDVTADLGIMSPHDNDARGEYYIPEEMGPGVGLFDFDADGDIDIFVPGGGPLLGDRPAQLSQLWRNDGERFSEVAAQVGAAVPGPAYGVACADHDGDGDVDVFVTRLGPDVLLRNDGGRFVDVTSEAGLGHDGFGTSAAFFDYDGDGWLDLYVANYLDWSPERERECFLSGVPDYCDPTSYDASAQDRLYRNREGRGFEDVTERAGIAGHRGNGLGVLAADFDADGWTDIYVANDSTPGMLWRNGGDGTFEDAALRMGCAYDSAGVAIAGMGVACEDLDADGRPDLFVTNIHGQRHLALLNQGQHFVDGSLRLGLARWSIPLTGFGVALFDQDHDGSWDVYVTDGGVNLTTDRINDAEPYAEPDQFARLVDGRFVDASSEGGASTSGVSAGGAGRGLATGDLDGDGDLDLVVTNNGGHLQVLQNQAHSMDDAQRAGAWLLVDVRSAAGGPALGARLTLRTGDVTHQRVVRAQSSYLSSSDPRVHFGLGPVRRVDELVVSWPDGTRRSLSDVALDQVLVVARD